MSDEDESGGVCIPAAHKERLLRSYESEMNFYKSRIEKLDDKADSKLKVELMKRAKVAENNLKEVEAIPVCEEYEDEDVETPVETASQTIASSPPVSHTPPQK